MHKKGQVEKFADKWSGPFYVSDAQSKRTCIIWNPDETDISFRRASNNWQIIASSIAVLSNCSMAPNAAEIVLDDYALEHEADTSQNATSTTNAA